MLYFLESTVSLITTPFVLKNEFQIFVVTVFVGLQLMHRSAVEKFSNG